MKCCDCIREHGALWLSLAVYSLWDALDALIEGRLLLTGMKERSLWMI